MSMSKVQTIERHALANGDTVMITKLGRQYKFVRLFAEDQSPYGEYCNLEKARSLLADALMQDVMEW